MAVENRNLQSLVCVCALVRNFRWLCAQWVNSNLMVRGRFSFWVVRVSRFDGADDMFRFGIVKIVILNGIL